jgi:hypothetical protein
MTQPQLSAGKRRWQGAAQKVIAMHQITSTFRPGALQVGFAGAQVAGSTSCIGGLAAMGHCCRQSRLLLV